MNYYKHMMMISCLKNRKQLNKQHNTTQHHGKKKHTHTQPHHESPWQYQPTLQCSSSVCRTYQQGFQQRSECEGGKLPHFFSYKNVPWVFVGGWVKYGISVCFFCWVGFALEFFLLKYPLLVVLLFSLALCTLSHNLGRT